MVHRAGYDATRVRSLSVIRQYDEFSKRLENEASAPELEGKKAPNARTVATKSRAFIDATQR